MISCEHEKKIKELQKDAGTHHKISTDKNNFPVFAIVKLIVKFLYILKDLIRFG